MAEVILQRQHRVSGEGLGVGLALASCVALSLSPLLCNTEPKER